MAQKIARTVTTWVAPIILAVALVAGLLYATGVFESDQNSASTQPPNTEQIETIAPGNDGAGSDAGRPTSPSSSPTQASLRFPAPFDDVDPSDPIAVMEAALTTLFSYHPADDESQMEAAERAKPLLGTAGVDAGFAALAPITGRQWRTWARDHQSVAAIARIPARGDNPDTDAIASRMAWVTQTVTDRAGRPAGRPLPPLSVFVTVGKDPKGVWRVDRIAVQS